MQRICASIAIIILEDLRNQQNVIMIDYMLMDCAKHVILLIITKEEQTRRNNKKKEVLMKSKKRNKLMLKLNLNPILQMRKKLHLYKRKVLFDL